MSATTTHNSNTTNNAGVPPAPSEAHQKAGFEGQTKVVTLNGARIVMRVMDGRWWNVAVS